MYIIFFNIFYAVSYACTYSATLRTRIPPPFSIVRLRFRTSPVNCNHIFALDKDNAYFPKYSNALYISTGNVSIKYSKISLESVIQTFQLSLINQRIMIYLRRYSTFQDWLLRISSVLEYTKYGRIALVD